MPLLPQLASPRAYRACEWDLLRDAEGRAYWLDHFIEHLDVLAALITAEYAPPADGLTRFRDEYVALFEELRRAPDRHGRLDVLLLDELRQGLMERYGWPDPFRHIKQREDEAALLLLPEVLAAADEQPVDEQPAYLAAGLMAGNIFDLGAKATIERFHANSHGFHDTLRELPPRPWFEDDVDAWAVQWAREPYRHVLWFVDNAGSDIVLGCLPLVRWMLRQGARVTLAANEKAALNDITAAELRPLIERVAAVDPVYGDARLAVVSSGNRAPLIDLTQLGEECVEAAVDADLIMLHGMGRSVESNRDAVFACDAVRSAILKDEAVAGHIGGRLFDCVFRYRRGQVLAG